MLDVFPLLHFVLFALLNTPPNFLWQQFLEDKFPAYSLADDGAKRLNKPNTAKKFALDQTVGAAINTLLFIAVIGAFRGKDGATLLADCQKVGCTFPKRGLAH